MKKAGILVVAFLTLFSFACGGGDGGNGGNGDDTPTPEVQATLIQVTSVDYSFDPEVIELKIGQPYQIQLLNQGEKSHRLDISASWTTPIQLFAAAGKESEVSQVIIPDTLGEFACNDKFYGARFQMVCSIVVIP